MASNAALPPLPLPLLAALKSRQSPSPAQSAKPTVAREGIDAEVGRQLQSDRRLIQSTLERLAQSVQELQTHHRLSVTELRHAAVELALTIATRLLHQQVNAGDFAIEALVRDMSAQLGDDVPVTIRLNSEDVALLESRLQGMPLFPEMETAPRFVADPSLARGDCRVEGKSITLLSELTGQLQEIRDELLRSLGHDVGS